MFQKGLEIGMVGVGILRYKLSFDSSRNHGFFELWLVSETRYILLFVDLEGNTTGKARVSEFIQNMKLTEIHNSTSYSCLTNPN